MALGLPTSKTRSTTLYRVEEGDYLGKSDGRISKIKSTEIIVVKVVKDDDSYRESPVVLKCDEWRQRR